ncbi:BREX-1 system adenine-specific DNA-methyltransferase PglX, partial [Salmonella enterica subsp. enterica serovar Ohio]|nr:BREX-1 system adenine-specific DNA-methyltransferase PglX [Salmonella enterica subsp. enterica serovar Ohio]
PSFYFKKGLTWNDISSGQFAMRWQDEKGLFEGKGPMAFCSKNTEYFLGLMNSKVSEKFLDFLCPTLNFNIGDISKIPIIEPTESQCENVINIVQKIISISKKDWDSYETSWNFKINSLLKNQTSQIKDGYQSFFSECQQDALSMAELESSNNNNFIHYYGLENELKGDVKVNEVSLSSNPFFRYGKDLLPEIQNYRFQSDTFTEFLSYTIGCMMGRYSLDREGLVYAHEGNKGFAELVSEGAYKTFPADNDGILPLMDDEWFDDDVTSRVKEFVRTVWGEEHLQENLEFIAESLCLYAIKPKKGESALDTIRRYLSTQFWKDHMKMYKKRPIYWLFSSGKEKAFECLVYLHRYHDATLARMRTEYVVPLLARYQANIDRLNEQVDGASGGEATRIKRERDNLSKKFNELRSFDDRLRHYADMRISIDLDDGVKVNYGKFGDLLADVKAITGNAPEII